MTCPLTRELANRVISNHMKIGIDIRLIGKKRTGDEAVFANLTRALASIDRSNEYFLFTDLSFREDIRNIVANLGLEGKDNFRIVPVASANRYVWNFFQIRRALKKHPVDVYLTQYITPFFIPRRIKIATIVHDISFTAFPQLIKFSDRFFLALLMRLSLRRADLVVAVSEFTRREIIRHYALVAKKIAVVPNAVGEDVLGRKVEKGEVLAVKQRYGIEGDYILYLGTLQPRKNIAFLIEAFAKLKKKMPDAKLVIAGGRSAHNVDKEIDEVARKLSLEKSVIFTGYVEETEKAPLLAGARVFAFPSLYEGFGIPILEAFAAGVPVVASDIEVLREVGADAALYADPRSLDGFADSLYAAYVDVEMRKRLTEAGKARVSFFSWEKSARRARSLFEGLAE